MSKYLNNHNLYKLPDYIKFYSNFINYIYDDKISSCNNIVELHYLIQKNYQKEVEKNITDYIESNFIDLTKNEKKELLENLIKAEQFTPSVRY